MKIHLISQPPHAFKERLGALDSLLSKPDMAKESDKTSLTALAEELLTATKRYESEADSEGPSERVQRLTLLRRVRDLSMLLQEPKEAIFDHFTNVCLFYESMQHMLVCTMFVLSL